VVLHQDFHSGNVLRATRERWLAIDPKPLVGEREFAAASLLRDRRWLLGGPGILLESVAASTFFPRISGSTGSACDGGGSPTRWREV